MTDMLRHLATRIYTLVMRLLHPREYATYLTFHNHTMVPPHLYMANLGLAKTAAGIPGAVVECGTWKGGMIAGIAKTLGPREYWLFDSFQGLPPAEEVDGERARQYQENTTAADYDNCIASEDDACEAMRLAGFPDAHLVKGWFDDTLPTAVFRDGIAVLRMDADWYKSTYQILDSLFDQVNEGGLIIIDDYAWWPGCRQAIHDYLETHGRRERVERFRRVFYMTKLPREWAVS